eukprot:scaffold32431_cov30-Tisochrysis_lutea.AAC.2
MSPDEYQRYQRLNAGAQEKIAGNRLPRDPCQNPLGLQSTPLANCKGIRGTSGHPQCATFPNIQSETSPSN